MWISSIINVLSGTQLLNIAGSRESKDPGIKEWVQEVLNLALFSTESLGGSKQ